MKNIVSGLEKTTMKQSIIRSFGKVVKSFGYGKMRRTFGGIRDTFYVNTEFDTEKCYSFYNSFKVAKEVKEVRSSITFDEYLGKLIFLKELNDGVKDEIERLKKFEPKGLFFE